MLGRLRMCCQSPQYLLPGLNHASGVSQDVDIFVLVILVDLGPWLEERLHEQVQEGWHPDLRRGTVGRGLGMEALALMGKLEGDGVETDSSVAQDGPLWGTFA